MPQKKEVFFHFNNPEVIEERNKLIAARIGRELGCGDGKIRDMHNTISALSQDPTPRRSGAEQIPGAFAPRRLREYLYEKLWTTKPDISREDVQKVITSCHEEAFDHLQKIYPDMWNIWVAVPDRDHIG